MSLKGRKAFNRPSLFPLPQLLVIGPVSVNCSLFLIRVTGGAGIYPSSALGQRQDNTQDRSLVHHAPHTHTPTQQQQFRVSDQPKVQLNSL